MKDLFILFAHLLTTIAKLLGPGGTKSVIADSLIMKQQLLVMSRPKQRSPKLSMLDRFLFGLFSLLLTPHRMGRTAVIIRLSTLLRFHKALRNRKYRSLFSSSSKSKPGPKGPSQELIQAIIELKRRNPRFGCPRIAQQIPHTFGVDIDKDVVRRVLAAHYHPSPGNGGPSWLSFIGHAKDSLWSVDLFRCESIHLKSHWVMVIMDQFTRRIVGFAAHAGDVDGTALCCMFNKAVSQQSIPRYLSSDNDPLFQYHQWQANLRILEITEIKTVPYVPLSHPFVERLIGTIRREYLDHLFFWNASDLERKLKAYQDYYNNHRVHSSLSGNTPAGSSEKPHLVKKRLNEFSWQSHCRGLFQLPITT